MTEVNTTIAKKDRSTTTLDVDSLRKEFPILQQELNGKPLVYLDNAATTQKPASVIECLEDYYRRYNSNVHRGVHHLSTLATDAFEGAREKVRRFICAGSVREVIFTSGTTASINLVANSLAERFKKGDEILISGMEHHSNIVPWQIMAEKRGALIKVIPVDDRGELDLEQLDRLLTNKTKMLALVHTSNSLGTINPVNDIIRKARKHGAWTLIDGAQAVSHQRVDVRELDCDFFCFSGHKVMGPTGIGVLYGKEQLLENMPPYMGGGEMIKSVSFEKTTFNELPYKFEAGTPNIAAAIGLGAAIDFVEGLGYDKIGEQENTLLEYATERLMSIKGLKIIGTAREKTSVISFLLKDFHPFDVGVILDNLGIATRTGHHCCQPLMHHYGIEGTCRASFSFYNTKEEVDRLVKGIEKASKMLS